MTTSYPPALGTPYAAHATKLLLLGSGELGKEFAISAQRLGLEVIAVDRYPQAPAMQVAHRSHVISMQDSQALLDVITREQPDFIVPEIEAIATEVLVAVEQQGFNVVPNAKATQYTMDRQRIRCLAAETLGLSTSPYQFANNESEYFAAVDRIGLPCIVKPVMSSSGKGQMLIENPAHIATAWKYAQQGARGDASTVIIEGFIDFDYEITLLTIRHRQGTAFCLPIGHQQVAGDYQLSWQPHPMSATTLQQAQHIATAVTDALGGYGLFGVEFFVKGEQVYFSELSPRPHDTGMVTLISQQLSEFDLHLRAILGLPIPAIRHYGPAASHVVLASGVSNDVRYDNIAAALQKPDTDLRLFGKPEINGSRRLGVALALGDDLEQAKLKATQAAKNVTVIFDKDDRRSR